MNTTVIGIYERTLNNCKVYEKEKNHKALLNEIGVLRGVAYVLDLVGVCYHSEDFIHFIDLQEKFKNEELPL